MKRLNWRLLLVLTPLAAFWAALGAAVCSAPAQANDRFTPPERFIAPTVAQVYTAPLHAIRAICIRLLNLHPLVNPIACAVIEDGKCYLYLPEPREVGYETFGRVYEHEAAHCWGWTKNHED